MAKIRLQIKSFDNERTKKNIVSSLQVIEKLPTNKVNGIYIFKYIVKYE